MSLPNVYHHRRVAESSAKPCYICHRPSSSVLITPDNKDFFYICPGHLKDRGFAEPLDAPTDDDAAKKKLHDEELQQEIERVKKEYEEKQKAKKDKKKNKDKKDKKKDEKKDEKKGGKKQEENDDDNDEADEKEKDQKIKELEKKKSEGATSNDPRVFALHKNIYQMRVNRIKSAQTSKQMQDRLSSPSSFPSVPSGFP